MARKEATPVRNRPLKTTPQGPLQIVSIVLETPPKYLAVSSGSNCSAPLIRPVRATSTRPPTQNSSASSKPVNCQPLA